MISRQLEALLKPFFSQLQDIIDAIRSNAEGGTNEDAMNDQPINCKRFHISLKEYWQLLADSKCLERAIANIRANELKHAQTDHTGVKVGGISYSRFNEIVTGIL